MSKYLTISKKGQITLPADLRKRLGFEAGDTVIAEERNGELILRPSAVLEIETYSEKDIARWDEQDHLDDQTRQKIMEKLEPKS